MSVKALKSSLDLSQLPPTLFFFFGGGLYSKLLRCDYKDSDVDYLFYVLSDRQLGFYGDSKKDELDSFVPVFKI